MDPRQFFSPLLDRTVQFNLSSDENGVSKPQFVGRVSKVYDNPAFAVVLTQFMGEDAVALVNWDNVTGHSCPPRESRPAKEQDPAAVVARHVAAYGSEHPFTNWFLAIKDSRVRCQIGQERIDGVMGEFTDVDGDLWLNIAQEGNGVPPIRVPWRHIVFVSVLKQKAFAATGASSAEADGDADGGLPNSVPALKPYGAPGAGAAVTAVVEHDGAQLDASKGFLD